MSKFRWSNFRFVIDRFRWSALILIAIGFAAGVLVGIAG